MIAHGWAAPSACRYRLISREPCVAVWSGVVFCAGGAGGKFYAHCWAAAPFLLLFCRRGTHGAAVRLWPGCYGDCAFRLAGEFLFFAALLFIWLWTKCTHPGCSFCNGFAVDHQRCPAEIGGGNGCVQEPEPVGGNAQDHHGRIYYYSPDWTINYVNHAGARLCGSTVAEMTGRKLWELFPDSVGTELEANFKKAMREREPVHFESFYPRLNRWYTISGYPGSLGLTVIFQDISEARQTREALRTTERRLQVAQVSARLGSWEWNVKTNELWWADGMWLVHGQPIGLMAPSFEHGMAFIHRDDLDRVQLAIQEALAGKGEYETEYRTTFPDGSVHWIGARGRVIFDKTGKPERMIGVAMDITSNKLAENALRKSEKLAAAGRLAATIAHEINNPLEAVTNLLYILRVNDKWDNNSRGYLAQAEHELARIAHVTRQTLGFYRDTTSPHVMDLPKIVEEALSLYLPRIQTKNIRLSREYDEAVKVMGLPGEIRQVVSNLVANAIDALPAAGALRIRVHHARELHNSHRAGGRIVIADTGSGITPEHRKKLFEPFYTTKQDVGTGLGLWVSREIVQKHGGNITLRSSVAPGHSGTVFSIFLPE